MKIFNYKTIDKGCVKSRFDVCIPQWGFLIKDFTLFEKDGRQWIGLPSKSYKGRDGLEKYTPVIKFNQQSKEIFERACIDKIHKRDFEHYQPKSV
jgi:hypothetical protein